VVLQIRYQDIAGRIIEGKDRNRRGSASFEGCIRCLPVRPLRLGRRDLGGRLRETNEAGHLNGQAVVPLGPWVVGSRGAIRPQGCVGGEDTVVTAEGAPASPFRGSQEKPYLTLPGGAGYAPGPFSITSWSAGRVSTASARSLSRRFSHEEMRQFAWRSALPSTPLLPEKLTSLPTVDLFRPEAADLGIKPGG